MTTCAHCGAPIVEAGEDGLWVHLDPDDEDRPDVCETGDDYSAHPRGEECPC